MYTAQSAALALYARFPIADRPSIFGRATVDAAGNEIIVSLAPIDGTLQDADMQNASSQLEVRMSSNDGREVQFAISTNDELLITPKNATAAALYGSPSDEGLLRLVFGQAR